MCMCIIVLWHVGQDGAALQRFFARCCAMECRALLVHQRLPCCKQTTWCCLMLSGAVWHVKGSLFLPHFGVNRVLSGQCPSSLGWFVMQACSGRDAAVLGSSGCSDASVHRTLLAILCVATGPYTSPTARRCIVFLGVLQGWFCEAGWPTLVSRSFPAHASAPYRGTRSCSAWLQTPKPTAYCYIWRSVQHIPCGFFNACNSIAQGPARYLHRVPHC